ncbi:MAG: (2Fe-2S)-binding protein [Halobacteriovoraceae bacterium]|nr:(2Fe-2S)-binding protein [Halobacteriovoraceae bacterium]
MTDELKNISNTEIMQCIDSLGEYLSLESEVSQLGELFCECNLVSYEAIRKEFDQGKLSYFSAIDQLRVGSGCGNCLKTCSLSKLYEKLKQ